MRVLFTGSRNWNDPLPIWRELQRLLGHYGSTLVIVHGGAPSGADFITERMCQTMGITTEPHPAAWSRFGKSAGPRRNAEMIGTGIDLVVAFRTSPDSRGTNDTIAKAQAAGIDVMIWEPKGVLPMSESRRPVRRAVEQVKKIGHRIEKTALMRAGDGMTLMPLQFASPIEAEAQVESWLGITKQEISDALVEAKFELQQAEEIWWNASSVEEPISDEEAYNMVMAYDAREKAKAWMDKCQEDLDVFIRSADYLYKHGYLRLELGLPNRHQQTLKLALAPDWPPPVDLDFWQLTQIVAAPPPSPEVEQAMDGLREKIKNQEPIARQLARKYGWDVGPAEVR